MIFSFSTTSPILNMPGLLDSSCFLSCELTVAMVVTYFVFGSVSMQCRLTLNSSCNPDLPLIMVSFLPVSPRTGITDKCHHTWHFALLEWVTHYVCYSCVQKWVSNSSFYILLLSYWGFLVSFIFQGERGIGDRTHDLHTEFHHQSFLFWEYCIVTNLPYYILSLIRNKIRGSLPQSKT